MSSGLGRSLTYTQFLRHASSKVSTEAVQIEKPFDARVEAVSNQNYKEFSRIPGPRGLPYFGTLFSYSNGPYKVSKYHDVLLERYRTYGKIFKETISGHTIVHLFDPEFIRKVYFAEGKIPHIRPLLEGIQLYRKYSEMSPGLGNTNGEEWYRLRTNINQLVMRPQSVAQFLPHINQVHDDFIQHLETLRGIRSLQVPNFENEIGKWILESFGMHCFETRLGSFESDGDSFQQEMIDANAVLFSQSLKLSFSVPWFKLVPQLSRAWRNLTKAEATLFRNGKKLLDETMEKINNLSEENKLKEGQYALVSYLLAKKDLSYKDISILVLSLFADGLSTIAPTTVGQLYCLAANPEAQEKLREEIHRLAPNPEAPVSANVLNKAVYLRACIKEGFRFFPIGVETSRVLQEDLVIGGYLVPAGTHVELNNNLLLRLKEYFPSPDEYRPERWLRGSPEAADIHPYLLLPFGFGPRTCPGRRFAEQEMQVLIIKLLQKYRIEWPHSYQMRQKYNVLLIPDCAADFKFIPL